MTENEQTEGMGYFESFGNAVLFIKQTIFNGGSTSLQHLQLIKGGKILTGRTVQFFNTDRRYVLKSYPFLSFFLSFHYSLKNSLF